MLSGLTVKYGVHRQQSEGFELQSKVMEPFRSEKCRAFQTVHLQREDLEPKMAQKGKA